MKSFFKSDFPLAPASAGLVLSLLCGSVAQGQVTVDVSKITCEQFLFSKMDQKTLATWLSGYYHGKRNSTVINLQDVKNNAKSVRSFCFQSSNLKTLLVDAVERVASKSQ